MNENVGDALHSLHHFKDVPPYAVYRAGKYLARLCDAADLLLGPGAAKLPDFVTIRDIADKSVVLKKKSTVLKDDRTRMFGIPKLQAHGVSDLMEEEQRVYDVEGDPDFVRKDQFFGTYKGADAEKIRAAIIAFGAAVPKALVDRRAEQQKAASAVQKKREQVADDHQ